MLIWFVDFKFRAFASTGDLYLYSIVEVTENKYWQYLASKDIDSKPKFIQMIADKVWYQSLAIFNLRPNRLTQAYTVKVNYLLRIKVLVFKIEPMYKTITLFWDSLWC